MQIVYNPEDGAPITSFICQGQRQDPHYPDGYVFPDGKVAGGKGLMQYNDFVAGELLETYQFLKPVTLEQAQEIIKRAEETKYKCDHPGCEFETSTKIALSGHMRKHAKDMAEANKPAIDESIIPVSRGTRIASMPKPGQQNETIEDQTKNGTDKDGVDWYGSGVQVQNRSTDLLAFGGLRTAGKGHFVG